MKKFAVVTSPAGDGGVGCCGLPENGPIRTDCLTDDPAITGGAGPEPTPTLRDGSAFQVFVSSTYEDLRELQGRRKINLTQARRLAVRFQVSIYLFI